MSVCVLCVCEGVHRLWKHPERTAIRHRHRTNSTAFQTHQWFNNNRQPEGATAAQTNQDQLGFSSVYTVSFPLTLRLQKHTTLPTRFSEFVSNFRTSEKNSVWGVAAYRRPSGEASGWPERIRDIKTVPDITFTLLPKQESSGVFPSMIKVGLS